MIKFTRTCLALAIVFSLAGTTALFAAFDGDQDENDDTAGDQYTSPLDISPIDPPGLAPTNHITDETVVELIENATKYCEPLLPKEYIIDCLSERLAAISQQLEGLEGYEDMQEILAATSKKLNQIARENRSTTLPPAAFSTKGESPIRTTRRLIPVDEAKMDDAISQAIVVIEEAETLLLRSAESSAERAVQFQRISAAIGSNKVLLRSL